MTEPETVESAGAARLERAKARIETPDDVVADMRDPQMGRETMDVMDGASVRYAIARAADRLTAALSREREARKAEITGEALSAAWKRYIDTFGEPPHGTEKQMAALLELTGLFRIAQGKQAESEAK